EDPFVIKNWRHLNNIRNETIDNPHFKLAASLNRDTVGYAEHASAEANGGQGWAPIPAFNHAGFTYFVFDGDDYRISDLVIDRPSSSNVGLFAETKSDDMIFETIIENAQVSGLSEVGLLVGVNRGEIYNSSSTGQVEASDSTNSNSGGLVGINHTTGRIIRSYSLAAVSGIGGGWYLGGLVGVNRGELTDCYAAGAVTGDRVGGLVGSNGVSGANDNASIDRCYAVAEVSSDNATGVGGLVGEEWTASTDIAPNSLWDIETSGQADPGDGGSPPSTGVGKTTAEMKSIATFTTALGSSLEWDFDNVWDIVNITQGDDTIVSYPFLRNNPQSPEPGRDYLQDFEPNNPGAGTDNDPYRIISWRHLANIARHPDAVFSLEQDLVASESDPDFVAFASSTANDGLGWLPIMGETAAFTGTLKGNDHSISGFAINRPDEDNVGLFAELGDDARIENLTIEATISGQSNIGVVAGFSGQATLDNVTVTNSSIQAGSTQTLTNAGAIDSDALESANAGGVIGQMDSGGSLVNASVTNTSINAQGARVGGLVGYLIQGSIQQSHATNTGVSGTTGVGGLVGRLSTRNNVPSSVIDESWARVNLNANDCP
ncbi:MAG TPA: GLUG motif-containing protein, partial [Wenzhouxiangella sp.]